MNNYIINTSPNAKSKDYHFYKMHEPATPTITVTISPTKQMKKFMNRMKDKYERNERDNHFIFQDNLCLKSFTNKDGEHYLKIKNLYGAAKLDVNIQVNYELLDSFVPEE
jgi:hypothetical protein